MTTGGHGGPAAGPPGPWRPAGAPTPPPGPPPGPPPAPDDGPAAGITGYGKLELFAHGGSALIFRGVQERVDRVVAIKVLTVDEQTTSHHIQREVDLTVRLSSHPHIVSIIDTGTTTTGNPYIVMEYCEGGSYAEILRRHGPRPVGEVVDIGIKIGEALHAAHGVGIIHRDVKPPNILRSRFGPALTDFGISRAANDMSSTYTLDKLTPYHASPEALERRPQSFRSDIYSLASTLWHLLAGRAPFIDTSEQVQDAVQFRLRVLTAPVPSLPRDDVPAWLEAELVRAMSKDEQHRHATALEFAQALRDGPAKGQPGWTPPSWPAQPYATDPWAPTSAPPATPMAGPDPDRTVVSRREESTGVPRTSAPVQPGEATVSGAAPVAAQSSAPPSSAPPASAPPASAPPSSVPPAAAPVVAPPTSTPPSSTAWVPPPAPAPAPAPSYGPGRSYSPAPSYPPQPYAPTPPTPPKRDEEPPARRRGLGVPLLVAAVIGLVLGLAVVAVLGGSLLRPSGNPTPTTPATLTKENAPTDIQIADSGATVTLSWKDHTGGRASYLITYTRQEAGAKPTALTSPPAASYKLAGLDATVDYCFTLAAFLSVNNLATADPVCTHRRSPGGN